MPTPNQSLSAVIVAGGKQYRVAPGDQILVDRVAGEPGSELELGRVLLLADGDDIQVGLPGLDGVKVTARVLGDRRGKKIEVLRYKSKKRVRVHRGARADLTALEILTVAGKGAEKKAEKAAKAERKAVKAEKPEKASKPAAKAAAKPAAKTAAAGSRSRAQAGSEEKTDGA